MSIKSKNKRVGIGLMVGATCIVTSGLWGVLLTPGTALAEDKPTTQNIPTIVDVVSYDPGISQGFQTTPTDFEFDLVLKTDGEGYEIDGDAVCVTIRIPTDGDFRIIFREGALELNDPGSPGIGLDLNATDGHATIYIPGVNYDVWVQARGKPGGSITWGESWRHNPLWQVHTVTRSKGKPTWDGPWWTGFHGFSWWISPSFHNNGLSCLAMRWLAL